MFAAGEVAEGYMALEIAPDWVGSLDKKLTDRLPLLALLHGIIFKDKDPKKSLDRFVLQMRERYKTNF